MEPDVLGLVPEVVASLGDEAGELPLPEAKLPEGWVPLAGVTQVCYWLTLFVIFTCFLLFDSTLCTYTGLEGGVSGCPPEVGQMLCSSWAETPGSPD